MSAPPSVDHSTHVVQAEAERRRARGSPLERMREVVRLRHLQVAPERDEPGDDDDDNDNDLDDPQDVQQAQPPAQLRAV